METIIKLILIIILIILSPSVFANWSLKRDYGDTIIYKSQNSTRLTLNYRSTLPKKKNFSKKLLKKLKKDKKKMLALIGVKEWKVTKSVIKRDKGNTSVILEGSYVDTGGELIYFVENHFYSAAKKLQILLTNRNLKNLKADAKDSNTQGFRVKYGF